jgi:hypothetical protein
MPDFCKPAATGEPVQIFVFVELATNLVGADNVKMTCPGVE